MSRPTADELEYRFLRESDLDALSRLIRSMSKGQEDGLQIRDNTGDYYRWMYFRNPAGDAIVASAWHEDKLVSSFAMAPKRIRTADGVHLYGKTMDMFTDPEYQGLRIMSHLTRTVFSESVAQGIDHWYVTPSGNSYPIFKNKWNYVEPFRLVYRTSILNSVGLSRAVAGGLPKRAAVAVLGSVPALAARMGLRLSRTHGVAIEEVESFPAEIDDFWMSASSGYGTILVRDAAYLNWRYRDNPDQYRIELARIDGAIVGYIVTKVTMRRGVRVGDIVDLLFPRSRPDVGVAMLRHVLARFRDEGCALAEVWDYNTCPNQRIYRRVGLIFGRARYRFVLSPGGRDASFYDPEQWYLTQGDGNDI